MQAETRKWPPAHRKSFIQTTQNKTFFITQTCSTSEFAVLIFYPALLPFVDTNMKIIQREHMNTDLKNKRIAVEMSRLRP